MNKFILLAILLPLAAHAQVEPRVVPGPFGANPGVETGGGIYPILSGPGVVNGNEVTGAVTLDLGRHFTYDGTPLNQIDTSMTIIYTIDGTPVSPRLKSPYTYTWDSTTVPDGAHAVSVILVDGAGNSASLVNGAPDTSEYFATATAFVVANTGKPPLGPQSLPSIGGGVLRVWYKTGIPTWLPWNTGYTWPHPASTVPYPAPVSAPANTRGLADAGLSQTFVGEQLTQANVTLENAGQRVVRSKTGYLSIEYFDPEISSTSDGAVAGVMAAAGIDGPRNDNIVSGYSTFVTNPDPAVRGYVGIDLAGRIFDLNLDGSVVTIAGRQTIKTVVPYSMNDPRVTEADRLAYQVNMIGTFGPGAKFNEPTDLAYDPRNKNILYVANEADSDILKVDFSVQPPAISVYAGSPGVVGTTDGPAASALFSGPNSLVVGADGTIYVADYDASNIRAIAPDGGVTRTISGVTQGLSQPFVVRFDSHGNLIIDEFTTGALKRVNPTTGAATLIKDGFCSGAWTWLAVDLKGNVGPIDDMFVNCTVGGDNSTLYRVSADGTRSVPAGNYALGGGHYPWAIVIDDNEARMLTTGFGDTAPHSFRYPVPSDNPDYNTGYQYSQMDPVTNRMWDGFDAYGTMPEFPYGAWPAQAALRSAGYSTFPGVLSYDDLAAMTTDQIGAYIQAGLGDPANPRPAATGRDLQLAVQDIQLGSALFPNRLLPILPFAPADTTPPVISNVQSSVSGTTATVTWTTDEPTLGYVRFGSSVNYFRWSTIETTFGTAHTVTLSDLPDSGTIHFAVVTEDAAANFTGTPDHTFVIGGVTPPPPIPTAVLGRTGSIIWSSSNATACTGVGFIAGAPSGSATVPAPGTYTLTCTNSGGTSPPASITVP